MSIQNYNTVLANVEARIQEFQEAQQERLHAQNITYIWEYLGWSQSEWHDYLIYKTVPEREYTSNSYHTIPEDSLMIQGFKAMLQQEESKPKFSIKRHFTQPDIHPFDQITWEKRQALITKSDGEVVFQQDDVEFPSTWSQNATNIVASKYFRTVNGLKEHSVSEMIDRVVGTIARWGYDDKYFNGEEYNTFLSELQYILVNQMASFNSPVWFNIGVPGTVQQASACYILSVEDSMPAILEWYRQEGMIFSRGSGSGVNVSKLRAKGEPISKGGVSSGPLSFMRAADASAFSIKSGGTTRRSARMVVMDMDHPDIKEFIFAKMREEKKARILAQAGYDDSLDGEIYATVAHQNCNMSVSASDEFLYRVETGDIWTTNSRTNYEGREHNAPELMRHIAEAAWDCGDPGMHFKTRMNEWHTCPNSGSIDSSNPCSEYIFLDNTACNLSSINLLKFLRDDNTFDIEGFCHTVDVMITAMEILVSRSEYPTEAITKNSEDFRTLGLGYANLGALLMAKGLPYDSDEGREYAASITALMTGQAYKRSAELAAIKGAFNGFEANREPMMQVISKHMDKIPEHYTTLDADIWMHAYNTWVKAESLGQEYGYRNAQVSLLAPTGTVSFMMDCTTTGVEPDVALVNYKKLVGGGTIKHVNDIVPRALKSLNLKNWEIQGAIIWLNEGYDIADYLHERPELLPVFDCAFPSKPGGRAIAWEGHVKMVAALQPFLSGSISKTINMPQESTVEDIERAYMMAWKLGCKSIAVYRDGCKQTQVLTTHNTKPSVKIPDDGRTESHFIADIVKDLENKKQGNEIFDVLKEWKPLSYEEYRNKLRNDLEFRIEELDKFVSNNDSQNIRELIADYENNSKPTMERTHYLHSVLTTEEKQAIYDFMNTQNENSKPQRRRLPDERQAITHKFSVNECEGYLTVGLFDDGTPGEIFLKMAKEGSTLSGFADGFACMVSMALQYGIPLDVMVNKFSHSRFEPSGWTNNENIKYASSIIDYVFRYLEQKFLKENRVGEHRDDARLEDLEIKESYYPSPPTKVFNASSFYSSYNVCPECGSMLRVNGSCHVCVTCGYQDGCTG